MLAFGAALGGLVSGVVGVYPAFVIDAVTFLLSALILLRMPYVTSLEEGSGPIYTGGHSPIPGRAGLPAAAHRHLFYRHSQGRAGLADHRLLSGGAGHHRRAVLPDRRGRQHQPGADLCDVGYRQRDRSDPRAPTGARDRDRRLRLAIAFGYVCAFVGFLISATLISLPVILFGGLLRGYRPAA